MDSNNRESAKESADEIAMYIFINTDLSMGKGKMVGQGSHVVSRITRNLEQMCYEQKKLNETCVKYKKWIGSGEAKIVLKATTTQLEELKKLPNSEYVLDQGRTQIAPNSLTAVGFYPDTKKNMEEITKDYKLL